MNANRANLSGLVALLTISLPCAPAQQPSPRTDREIIEILLEGNLGQRRFAFPSVIEAASGCKVIPFETSRPSHQRVSRAIETCIQKVIDEMNADSSPIRSLRRINEASRYFEDALLRNLNEVDGLSCEIPQNADGQARRSGYPDLRIVDKASSEVFYLDPKLIEKTALASTFRTFYYEPRETSGKIRNHAVHLLLGIEHDGNQGKWRFSRWHLIDLSHVTLKLKAEFQSSNAEIYENANSRLPTGKGCPQTSQEP